MTENKLKNVLINDTGASATEVVAVALSLVWMAGVGLFFLVMPPTDSGEGSADSLRIVMTLIAIFMPVAMIWVAAAAARSARIIREESQRLHLAIPDDQPALALGTSAEDMSLPLPRKDLIRALNFPDTDQDTDGFSALRRALKDRQARQLVQASEDVLTLLSQDGIYMDDLRPDRARPELWRRFEQAAADEDIIALSETRTARAFMLLGRVTGTFD